MSDPITNLDVAYEGQTHNNIPPAETYSKEHAFRAESNLSQQRFMPGYHDDHIFNFLWSGLTKSEASETADPYNMTGSAISTARILSSEYEIMQPEGGTKWSPLFGHRPDSSPRIEADASLISKDEYQHKFQGLQDMGIAVDWQEGMTRGQAIFRNQLKLKEYLINKELGRLNANGYLGFGHMISTLPKRIVYDNARDPFNLWGNLIAWDKIPKALGIAQSSFRSGVISGAVAGAAVEGINYPLNLYSGLNYTPTESLFNIGTSAAFGGALTKAMAFPEYWPQVSQMATGVGGEVLGVASSIMPSQKLDELSKVLKNVSNDTKVQLVLQKVKRQLIEGKDVDDILTLFNDPKMEAYLLGQVDSYDDYLLSAYRDFNFKDPSAFAHFLTTNKDIYLFEKAFQHLEELPTPPEDPSIVIKQYVEEQGMDLDMSDPLSQQSLSVGKWLFEVKNLYDFSDRKGALAWQFYHGDVASKRKTLEEALQRQQRLEEVYLQTDNELHSTFGEFLSGAKDSIEQNLGKEAIDDYLFNYAAAIMGKKVPRVEGVSDSNDLKYVKRDWKEVKEFLLEEVDIFGLHAIEDDLRKFKNWKDVIRYLEGKDRDEYQHAFAEKLKERALLFKKREGPELSEEQEELLRQAHDRVHPFDEEDMASNWADEEPDPFTESRYGGTYIPEPAYTREIINLRKQLHEHDEIARELGVDPDEMPMEAPMYAASERGREGVKELEAHKADLQVFAKEAFEEQVREIDSRLRMVETIDDVSAQWHDSGSSEYIPALQEQKNQLIQELHARGFAIEAPISPEGGVSPKIGSEGALPERVDFINDPVKALEENVNIVWPQEILGSHDHHDQTQANKLIYYSGPNTLSRILKNHPSPRIAELGHRMEEAADVRRGKPSMPDSDASAVLTQVREAGLSDKEIDNLVFTHAPVMDDKLVGRARKGRPPLEPQRRIVFEGDEEKILKNFLKGKGGDISFLEKYSGRITSTAVHDGKPTIIDIGDTIGFHLFLKDVDQHRLLDIKMSPRQTYKKWKLENEIFSEIFHGAAMYSPKKDLYRQVFPSDKLFLQLKANLVDSIAMEGASPNKVYRPEDYMIVVYDKYDNFVSYLSPRDFFDFDSPEIPPTITDFLTGEPVDLSKDETGFLNAMAEAGNSEAFNRLRSFLSEWGPVMENHTKLDGTPISIGDLTTVLSDRNSFIEFTIAHERAHYINRDFLTEGVETQQQVESRNLQTWVKRIRAEEGANLSAFNYVQRMQHLQRRTANRNPSDSLVDIRRIADEVLQIETAARMEAQFYTMFGVDRGRQLLNNPFALVQTANDANVRNVIEFSTELVENANGEWVEKLVGTQRKTDPQQDPDYTPTGFRLKFKEKGGTEYLRDLNTALKQFKDSHPNASKLSMYRLIKAYTSIVDVAINAEIKKRGVSGSDSPLARIGRDGIKSLHGTRWEALGSLQDFIIHTLNNPKWQEYLSTLDVLDPADARKHAPDGWSELANSIEEFAHPGHRPDAARDLIFSAADFLTHDKDVASPTLLYPGYSQAQKKALQSQPSEEKAKSERITTPPLSSKDPMALEKWYATERFNLAGKELDDLSGQNLDLVFSPEELNNAKTHLLKEQRAAQLQLRTISQLEDAVKLFDGDATKAVDALINGSPKMSGADQWITGKARTWMGSFMGELDQQGLSQQFINLKPEESKLVYEAMWALDHNEIDGAKINIDHIPQHLVSIGSMIRKHRQIQMGESNQNGANMQWMKGHARVRTTSPAQVYSADGFITAFKNPEKAKRQWIDFVKNNNLNRQLTFKIISETPTHSVVDPKGLLGVRYLQHKREEMIRDLNEQINTASMGGLDLSMVNLLKQERNQLMGANGRDIVFEQLSKYTDGELRLSKNDVSKFEDDALYEIIDAILSTSREGKSDTAVEQLARSREIVFEGWEDNFNYDRKYSSNSFQESILTNMENNARLLGLIKHFGEDPEDFMSRVIRRYGLQGKGIYPGIKNSFRKLTGELDVPENITLNRIGAALRTFSITAHLEKVMFASLPDLGNITNTLHLQGMKGPELEIQRMKDYAKTEEGRNMLRNLGVGIEGFLGDAGLKLGFSEHSQAAIANTQKLAMKAFGMTYWNARNQSLFLTTQANYLGENAKKAFNDLPEGLSNVLTRHGINELEWNIISSGIIGINTETAGTRPFISIESIDKADSDLIRNYAERARRSEHSVKQELKDKVQSLFIEQMNQAVLMPGNKEMSMLHGGTKAGTVEGELRRLMMLYKAYPMSSATKIVPSNARNIISNPLKGGSTYLMYVAKCMGLGYIARALKDLSSNNMPTDPFADEDGLLSIRTVKDSGILPFFFDAINQEYFAESEKNEKRNKWLQGGIDTAAYIAGPLSSIPKGLYEAYLTEREGGRRSEAKATRQRINTIKSNIPGLDYPLTAWATNAILNKYIMEWADDGYNYRRNSAFIDHKWGPVYDIFNNAGLNLRPGDAFIPTYNEKEGRALDRKTKRVREKR